MYNWFFFYQNGIISEVEFEKMAFQVVKVAGIFTGAENGRSSVDSLTTSQLDALIEHQWPDPKLKVADQTDPLALIIENIKQQSNCSASDKTQATKNKKVDYNSLVNSRNARLKFVLDIGRKLRKEGIFFVLSA